jgi:arsenate reductase (thioredoxin)
MAEAFLNKWGDEHFIAESAGIEPGNLNAYVVSVMREIGIDLSKKETRGVWDVYKQGKTYDIVITVCDAASAEQCPVFPGKVKRESWSFPDPSHFKGTEEEILLQVRTVRDEIEARVLQFIKEAKEFNYWFQKKNRDENNTGA